MNQHFGKLGDIWKHLPLAEILKIRPPLPYWETHAGSASYAMNKISESAHGATRFLSHAPEDPDLGACAYLNMLQLNPDVYPGSSMIAIQSLGTKADYLFCDLDPESIETLKEAATGVNAQVIERDGVSTIGKESELKRVYAGDVFVHIDPFDPHQRLTPDSRTPIELAGHLAKAGYRVFYWYGYDSETERGCALSEIANVAPNVELWCGDVLMPAPFVYPGKQGAWGCGIILANATPAEIEVCECLGTALERISETDVLQGNAPNRLTFKILK